MKEGERVWVAWSNKGVFDAHGNLTEVLCIGNDNTAHRLANLLRANDQAVQAMALAIEMRDPYTSGHQQRVSLLACALAREMGLPEDRIRGLRLAGLLHDLGKIASLLIPRWPKLCSDITTNTTFWIFLPSIRVRGPERRLPVEVKITQLVEQIETQAEDLAPFGRRGASR